MSLEKLFNIKDCYEVELLTSLIVWKVNQLKDLVSKIYFTCFVSSNNKTQAFSKAERVQLSQKIIMLRNCSLKAESMKHLEDNLEGYLVNFSNPQRASLKEDLEAYLDKLGIDLNTIKIFNALVFEEGIDPKDDADIYDTIIKLLNEAQVAEYVKKIHINHFTSWLNDQNSSEKSLHELKAKIKDEPGKLKEAYDWGKELFNSYVKYLEKKEEAVKYIDYLNRYIKPSASGAGEIRLDSFSIWEDEDKISSEQASFSASLNSLSRSYKLYSVLMYGALFFLSLTHFNIGFLNASIIPFFSLKSLASVIVHALSILCALFLFIITLSGLEKNVISLKFNVGIIAISFAFFCLSSYFAGIFATSYMARMIIYMLTLSLTLFSFANLILMSAGFLKRKRFSQKIVKTYGRNIYTLFFAIFLSILNIIPFFVWNVAPFVLCNYNLFLFAGVGLGVYGYLSLTTPLLALASASIGAYALGKIMASYVHYVQNSFAKRHEEFKGLTKIQSAWLKLKIIMMSCITYFSAGRIAYSGRSYKDLKLTLVHNRSFKNILPNGKIHPTLIIDVVMVSLSFVVLSFFPGLSALSQLLVATLPIALTSNVLAVIAPNKMRLTKPGESALRAMKLNPNSKISYKKFCNYKGKAMNVLDYDELVNHYGPIADID